jgi:alkylation response protein AidB-like acyl-CoA dehydrogenase
MDFALSDVQAAWQAKGAALGGDVAQDPAAAGVIVGAARHGLLDPQADLIAVAVAVEAMAAESPAAAVIFALHSATALAVAGDARFASLFRGEAVAAVGLSSDDIPVDTEGKLSGRASWVAPITARGVAVVSPRSSTTSNRGQPIEARRDGARTAYVVSFDTPGIAVAPIRTAGLLGLVCGHVTFTDAPYEPIGPTLPIMTRVRLFMAAAGLGMGRRALREALATARAAHTAAAGEQTVQGLLADAATDLDAAMLLIWQAAHVAPGDASLGGASMAKLMATAAAQRAVERATQVVGADTFQGGHIIERLAQDVRALELFGGRTEALRAAVAEEILPPLPTG